MKVSNQSFIPVELTSAGQYRTESLFLDDVRIVGNFIYEKIQTKTNVDH